MELTQVAQRVEDLDRAVEFYARLLGSEPVGRFEPPGLAFFRLGSVRLLLERGAPSAMLYLQVDDVRARIEALRADGVPIEAEPHMIFSHTGRHARAGRDRRVDGVHPGQRGQPGRPGRPPGGSGTALTRGRAVSRGGAAWHDGPEMARGAAADDRSDRRAVARLWQLYPTTCPSSGTRGRTPRAGSGPGACPTYYDDPDSAGFVITQDSNLAGFAFVMGAQRGRPRHIGDFFVVLGTSGVAAWGTPQRGSCWPTIRGPGRSASRSKTGGCPTSGGGCDR